MNRYDAVMVFGVAVVLLAIFFKLICVTSDVTLFESFIVLWLSYRASGRLYKYDINKEYRHR